MPPRKRGKNEHQPEGSGVSELKRALNLALEFSAWKSQAKGFFLESSSPEPIKRTLLECAFFYIWVLMGGFTSCEKDSSVSRGA